MVTQAVYAELEFRMPTMLKDINYTLVNFTDNERTFASTLIELTPALYNKRNFTIADVSLIAIATMRQLDILTDNRGISWFFDELLKRPYRREPYRSKTAAISSKISYYPQICTSFTLLRETYGENISVDIVANFTASSNFWFRKEELNSINLSWEDYIRAVIELRKK
jgi:hypothetical protein